ncbi:MAG: DUF5657 family protein [Candidatus Woesebacteria bacterium]
MPTAVPQILGAVFDPSSPFLFSGAFLLTVLRFMFLIGFGLYIIFAFAVIRQIALMTRTLKTGANVFVHLLGWIHFGVAVVIWLVAFFVL